MLVISRRTNEDVVFPGLGITLKVLRAQGNRAHLGIEAPRNIEVLRSEVVLPEGEIPSDHRLRNALNTVSLLLEMYDRQVRHGRIEQAHGTYEQVLAKLAEMDVAFSPILSETGSDGTPTPHSARVLVVEDDDNERELLADLLRVSGYEVVTANNGCQALDELTDGPRPDYILLDIQMPHVDGRVMLEVIRKTPQLADIPVFVISGRRADEVGITVGGDSKVSRWFQKPINTAEVMRAMQHRKTAPTAAT